VIDADVPDRRGCTGLAVSEGAVFAMRLVVVSSQGLGEGCRHIECALRGALG
jgi:hypothetical protein